MGQVTGYTQDLMLGMAGTLQSNAWLIFSSTPVPKKITRTCWLIAHQLLLKIEEENLGQPLSTLLRWPPEDTPEACRIHTAQVGRWLGRLAIKKADLTDYMVYTFLQRHLKTIPTVPAMNLHFVAVQLEQQIATQQLRYISYPI